MDLIGKKREKKMKNKTWIFGVNTHVHKSAISVISSSGIV